MFIKKTIMPALLTLMITASSFAQAKNDVPCAPNSLDACWQICKIDNVDHMVCGRSVMSRINDCQKRNGQIYPATGRCGWGYNCNGCTN